MKKVIDGKGEKPTRRLSPEPDSHASPTNYFDQALKAFEKNVDITGLFSWVNAIFQTCEFESFIQTVNLLVPKMQIPLMIAELAEFIRKLEVDDWENNKQLRFVLVLLQHAKNKGYVDEEGLFEKLLSEYASLNSDSEDYQKPLVLPLGETSTEENLEDVLQEICEASTIYATPHKVFLPDNGVKSDSIFGDGILSLDAGIVTSSSISENEQSSASDFDDLCDYEDYAEESVGKGLALPIPAKTKDSYTRYQTPSVNKVLSSGPRITFTAFDSRDSSSFSSDSSTSSL